MCIDDKVVSSKNSNRRSLIGAIYRKFGTAEAIRFAKSIKMRKSGTYGWYNLIWERILLDTDYFDNLLDKEFGFERNKIKSEEDVLGPSFYLLVWAEQGRKGHYRKI